MGIQSEAVSPEHKCEAGEVLAYVSRMDALCFT